MNLVLVDKCTNSCAYCFASTVMAKSSSRGELSRVAIEEVASFVGRSGPQFEMNLIGGEPFLYKDIDYLLDRLIAEPAFGHATIFTGGIFATRALDILPRFRDRISILVNLNERRDYQHAADYEVVLRNMAHALDCGIRTTVGFNIWRADFDYEEILSVCHRFGIEHLRWTVAYPEAKPMPGIIVLSPAEYPQVARRCALFLETAYSSGVECYLDCPLPKCFFTSEELGRIVLTHPKSASQIRSCGPVIDVGPDLTVFRCYALSNQNRRHLSEFDNFNELVAWYQREIDDRYARPHVFDACAACEFAADRSCFGGCMGHNVESLGARAASDDILRSVYAALAGQRFDDAHKLLDALPHQDAPAGLLRAHVEKLRGDISQAIQWARLAVNRSRTPAMRDQASSLLRLLSKEVILRCSENVWPDDQNPHDDSFVELNVISHEALEVPNG